MSYGVEAGMPITYTIEKKQGLIRTRAWGALTDEDVLDHVRRLGEDPDNDPSLDALFDGREVEQLQVTGEAVREAALLMRSKLDTPPGRMAMVAANESGFGMSRMYELLRPDLEVMVFRSMDEAQSWLANKP